MSCASSNTRRGPRKLVAGNEKELSRLATLALGHLEFADYLLKERCGRFAGKKDVVAELARIKPLIMSLRLDDVDDKFAVVVDCCHSILFSIPAMAAKYSHTAWSKDQHSCLSLAGYLGFGPASTVPQHHC